MQSLSPTRETARRARLDPPEEVDVAIVGAGLGGLSAGAYLARAGLKVAIFDSHYVAGGCATQFARKGPSGRYVFDVGVHYIGECGPDGELTRLLRGAGAETEFVPLDPDGFDTVVFPDQQFRIPANLDLYRQRLIDAFPGEVRGIDRYVRLVREIDVMNRVTGPARGAINARVAWTALTRGRLVIRAMNQSIGRFLDGCTLNPRLRAIILAQHGDYALPPAETSAVLHGGLARHYFGGAWYPKGGGQMMADDLAASVEASGGTIHLRRGVARILVDDRRAVGLETEVRHGQSHRVRARVVISNADLANTLTRLIGPEHLPARMLKKADAWQMPEALFITMLGVKGDLAEDGMGSTNYWQFDTDDFDDLYRRIRTDPEPIAHAAYITSASLKDPDTPHHAPDGITNVEVMGILSGDPVKWGVQAGGVVGWNYKKNDVYRARKQAVEDQLIARLDRLFPGTADRVVYRESASPMSHTRFTRSRGGTGYGIAVTPGQFLANRPAHRGPLGGLYLCGASTRSGHGVGGALLGGYVTAGMVARELGRSVPDVYARS